jgi:N-acetylglucosaminyl-diphospho-decaprenol L-rhamnosyltransferase
VKLLIVIVNYRTADLTIDALASVAPQINEPALETAKVVVVDNDSGDGSADRIAAAIAKHGWGTWAELLRAERNGGFAYGNNVAIRPALASADPPRYIMLLNPDTVARPGALTSLLEFMEQHPEVGIAGSRLEWPDGTPQLSAFRFHSVLSELEQALQLGVATKLLRRWMVAPGIADQPGPADWVSGAAMMIRREVFESIGLMDEDYFMYYEEVDFTARAARAGFACWYVPASRVVHLIGQASGVTDPRQRRKRRPGYWFDSRRRYFVRNLGPVQAGLADLAWTAGHVLWRARRVIQRKPDPDPERLLTDFIRHSVFARGFDA